MNKQNKTGLGRGLSALLGEETKDAAREPDKIRSPGTIPIEHLHPGRYQPRHVMEEGALEELAASMREKGILQPLLVRRDEADPEKYEIVAGERRWRAAQKAGIHEIPVIVRALSDRDALEVGLIENLQRQDLSPSEEAMGYRRLMEEFQHTQEQLATVVGKSRSHVANTLRLLNLPTTITALLDEGTLSPGHARALMACAHPEKLAGRVVAEGLSVRQTEQLAKTWSAKGAGTTKTKPLKDANTLALEKDLSDVLGMRVTLSNATKGATKGRGGSLTVFYSTLDQLDDVVLRLRYAPRKTEPH